MVIWLVPHGDFLLPDFDSQFSIYLLSHRSLRRYGIVLEYFAHVVEQMRDRQHDRGRLQAVPAVQEELSVLVSLCGGLGEPVMSLFLVLPVQIQLAESILRILVAALRRLG